MSAAALQLLALALLNVALAWMAGAWAARPARAAAPVLLAATAAALLASVAALWAEAAVMADAGLGDALLAIGPVLRETHYGHAWALGLAALALTGLLAWRAPASPASTGLLALTIAGFAFSRSAVSHAAAAEGWLPLAADWLHLIAVSLWAGEVFIAATVTLAHRVSQPTAREIERLSNRATAALAVVLATGAFSAWQRLAGPPAQWLASGYGLVLVLKLGGVATAMALGGFNRWAVMPALLRPAASGMRTAALQRFRRVLRIEACVLLAVLLAAARLATLSPE